MNTTTQKRLEKAGWKIGSAAEFLQLTPEEASFIELKLALALRLREVRERQGLSQAGLAQKIGSSQSRVAKMEAGNRSVSLGPLDSDAAQPRRGSSPNRQVHLGRRSLIAGR